LRFALIYGNALGNDQAMSYSKLESARKFTNKLWNMARFIEMQIKENNISLTKEGLKHSEVQGEDAEILYKTKGLAKDVTKFIEAYQFNLAAETLYDFIWHTVADKYIEYTKTSSDRRHSIALLYDVVFRDCLKLLHPFMPFVTEEIFQRLYPEEAREKALIISAWPN